MQVEWSRVASSEETRSDMWPPPAYNQFCVERFDGYAKSILSTRAEAAESMAQKYLPLEACKLFYNEPFVTASYGLSVTSGNTTDVKSKDVNV